MVSLKSHTSTMLSVRRYCLMWLRGTLWYAYTQINTQHRVCYPKRDGRGEVYPRTPMDS